MNYFGKLFATVAALVLLGIDSTRAQDPE